MAGGPEGCVACAACSDERTQPRTPLLMWPLRAAGVSQACCWGAGTAESQVAKVGGWGLGKQVGVTAG